jgi:hypothetical protein
MVATYKEMPLPAIMGFALQSRAQKRTNIFNQNCLNNA